MAEEKRQLLDELSRINELIRSGQINRLPLRWRIYYQQRKRDIEKRLRQIDYEERR